MRLIVTVVTIVTIVKCWLHLIIQTIVSLIYLFTLGNNKNTIRATVRL